MTAILDRFRIQNFRSVRDSGWIDSAELTAFIGTNEAGKTNLLLPLWKLRPANQEPIDPLADYPRLLYSQFKADGDENPFVTADFTLDDSQAALLAEALKIDKCYCSHIRFSRYWDGLYRAFALDIENGGFDTKATTNLISHHLKAIESAGAFEGSKLFAGAFKSTVDKSKSWQKSEIATNLAAFASEIEKIEYQADENQKALIVTTVNDIKIASEILSSSGYLSDTHFKIAFSFLPSFVYYSDYGNLNSEIYLPRVIEDMGRKDLRGLEKDKARTLKVLFEFVNLTPKDILELGKEQLHDVNKPAEVIAAEATKKREREVLLRSASTSLTKSFRSWWKQGNYEFRFQADGNHFRIWVSDDVRREEIELENRSRGLQWFFSFFLVFLVEKGDAHQGCILLLDEPGVTLHPNAQGDLIEFFNSLSKENQVLYTTHSPFLIDSKNLGNVKAVFVDEEGFSSVSTDLRKGSKVAERSVYPAHAAVGLTVSETFLNGCQPVLVEGVSDQIYLHAIKNRLVKNNLISPTREIVFIPTGGVKGMKPIINIISSKDASLPVAVLDGDSAGLKMISTLKTELYKGEEDKVINVADHTSISNAEIEDLFSADVLADSFDRLYRVDDYALADGITNQNSFMEQAEKFIKNHGVPVKAGWKVDLAKDVVKRLPKRNISEEILNRWAVLLTKISQFAEE